MDLYGFCSPTCARFHKNEPCVKITNLLLVYLKHVKCLAALLQNEYHSVVWEQIIYFHYILYFIFIFKLVFCAGTRTGTALRCADLVRRCGGAWLWGWLCERTAAPPASGPPQTAESARTSAATGSSPTHPPASRRPAWDRETGGRETSRETRKRLTNKARQILINEWHPV